MKCAGFSIWFTLWSSLLPIASLVLVLSPAAAADDEVIPEGVSTREARAQATRGIPWERLNPAVTQDVRDVLENPSYFRRMPPQEISCDPRMFTFLVRRPEVMVNIWEVMGITKVQARRTSPYSFLANDGVGTNCRCDLVYSDEQLHIYVGNGVYDGSLAPRKVTGRCVCLLRIEPQWTAADAPNISGTMDVFLKVDNFGADLLTRTIGPFVGKTADYNFVETAKFISQISHVCRTNPDAAQALAERLDRIDDSTRREFSTLVVQLASHPVQPPMAALATPQLTSQSVAPPALQAAPETIAQSISPSGSLPSPAAGHAPAPAAAPASSPAATFLAPRKPHIFMRR